MSVTQNEIIELAASFFEYPIEKINEQSGISIIPGWDSLGHVSFCIEVERKYDVVIDDSNIANLLTIADFLIFLNELR